MPRLFVALVPKSDVRRGLGALQVGLEGVRWVASEFLHLTVRYIGEVSRLQTEDVIYELGEIDHCSFSVKFGNVGFFSSGGRVRSLWVGIDNSFSLMSLKESVDARLRRVGIESESRNYIPHVTLGRGGVTPYKLDNFLSWASSIVQQPMIVDRYVLMCSERLRKGPVYTSIANYSLLGPLEQGRSLKGP